MHVDVDKHSLTINKNLPGQVATLQEVVLGLQAFQELNIVAKQLWEILDYAILKPRTNLTIGNLSSIKVAEVCLDPNN